MRLESDAPMIRYVAGDATAPIGTGLRVICHVCNDRGAWGAGFVLALSRRWLEPERLYREHSTFRLGEVMFATVDNDILVANMVAQRGFPSAKLPVAIDYGALESCLGLVSAFCADQDGTVHMPRIGCGIAGGDWHTVEHIIEKTLSAANVPVTVYDLPNQSSSRKQTP